MIGSLVQGDWLMLVRLLAAFLFVECFFQLPFWKPLKSSTKCIVMVQLIHSAAAGVISYLFAFCFAFHLDAIWLIFIIFCSRIVMNILEIRNKKINAIKFNIIKHLVYLLVIAGSWIGLVGISKIPIEKSFLFFSNLSIWIVSLSYITLIWPVGYLIGVITKPWRDELEQSYTDRTGEKVHPLKNKKGKSPEDMQKGESQPNRHGLANAGLWLGWLERILILTFVLIGKYEAIGFLITAKSIFRYSEIKCATDRKEVEYILIGTMLSFVTAFHVGIFTAWLLIQIKP